MYLKLTLVDELIRIETNSFRVKELTFRCRFSDIVSSGSIMIEMLKKRASSRTPCNYQ